MGIGSGGKRAWPPPWIFIHNTDIVDKGLIVLFFGVFLLFFVTFSAAPPPRPLEIFLLTPLIRVKVRLRIGVSGNTFSVKQFSSKYSIDPLKCVHICFCFGTCLSML